MSDKPVTGPDGANPITDEQIEDLRDAAGLAGQYWIVTDTYEATTLGRTDMLTYSVTPAMRNAARDRCAKAWNAQRGTIGEDAARRLADAKPGHCTTCKGPIDADGECRCEDARRGAAR